MIRDAQRTIVIYTIKSFKHKGLRLFFETDACSGIQPKHQNKLCMQLAALNTAQCIEDMDLPGYHLHQLNGQRKDCWSITINGNWRMTFINDLFTK